MSKLLTPEQYRIKRSMAAKKPVKLTATEREYLIALLDERRQTDEAANSREADYIDVLKEAINS